MKENKKLDKIKHLKRHKWYQIGNGYSKCSDCGLVKYHRTKTEAATYSYNGVHVENNGCDNKYYHNVICSHEFVSREYKSQPYGTCLCCGKTVFS